MNCSATIFFRACRARPVPAPSRSLVLPPRSTSAPFLKSTSQNGRNLTYQCHRGIGQQRAAFSSTSTLGHAQPVNDIPAAASEGGEVSGKGGEGENLTQTVISRAQTDQQQQSSTLSSSTISKTGATAAAQQPPVSDNSPSSTTESDPIAAADAAFLATSFKLTGHVTRVGTMRKTVRVSRTVQVWDKFLQKHWKKTAHDLVHDPQDILNEGDVITYGPFPPSMRAAREQRGQVGGNKQVSHVLREVITPFGTPVEQRVSRIVGSPAGRWHGTPGQVQVQKGGSRTRPRGKDAVNVPSSKKNAEAAA
ncbi:hypothetical protein A1O3_03068 [Capronia epimyces CBS 606.96]|uniref:Uncharacterized protein n=1 Tax=Capronia epimyces CBS 606.96 TaxID=1182542 RepID=W9YJZ4_9EURO|nr:uncharacterized protein A1O3_03068 [Capronia epimyces CBS 606.96]EXJ90000.1 hypothetical protein A1O3_03068 [Capronia epimyces CBS 606.96]